jgi:cytidylate kinase
MSQATEKKLDVVAIDGPAGTGKSTVSRLLAQAIGALYVDSGAFYRALTLAAVQQKANLENPAELADIAAKASVRLEENPSGLKVLLNGRDVSAEIRTPEITKQVHYLASAEGVRRVVVGLLREFGKSHRIVMEGRDITTVVFPDAAVKIYLDASPEIRAERRAAELRGKGLSVDFQAVLSEIVERDGRDRNRAVGPLRQTPDAVYVDTTNLSIDGVVKVLAAKCLEKCPQWKRP